MITTNEQATKAVCEMLTLFTAVGFSSDEDTGFTASLAVHGRDPQTIADLLEEQFDTVFDQILLMKNGLEGPVVAEHWTVGKHYNRVE